MTAQNDIAVQDHGTEIEGDTRLLEQIEMPWGFRLRPADMQEKALDVIIEWGLTLLGVAFLLAAFAQWLLPGALYVGDALMLKLVLTGVLGL
ncbi:MAG: hypothetical protein OIF48_14855, partial [Silicimonas sp.]|nr:hypothetical protein [Silicimonas sp.]